MAPFYELDWHALFMTPFVLHYEETVYFLPLSPQEYLVLISFISEGLNPNYMLVQALGPNLIARFSGIFNSSIFSMKIFSKKSI